MRPTLLLALLVTTVAASLACLAPDRPLSAPTSLGAATSTPVAQRNADRARTISASIQHTFFASGGRYVEVWPSDSGAYATLWPLTQTVSAMLVASRLTGVLPDSLSEFAPYWDATVSPPGYSASMQPPLGSGDRKFFDDNAWTGLALVQAYRVSGDSAALARARQLFDFSVSGWDADATHADPGGVWWSQQMPNPRFIHRNTVSTASSAELGLQLYEAGGRTEPYYLDWATRMYTWVNTYLRGSNGLYGDHVDLAGVVDPGQLTYNQGTMIGASVLLYRATGDVTFLQTARSVADTSLLVFGPDFAQPPAYNAVFFRNLLLLGTATGDDDYRAAAQAYADTTWESKRNASTGLLDFVYGRNQAAVPHRLLDQAAMLQIYAALALGSDAAEVLT